MALPELSGFAFDRVIGRGGTATVYLAVQAPFDRQVAVKIYQGQITEDQSRRVFEKECRAIGQLSARQGFAAFYAAGFMDDGAPYLVMQYYPKGSLAGLVRTSGPLSTDEVIGVVRRIGGALVASHAAGIYHRDVKPENMLIDDEGLPVLSDFGISAIGDAASSRSVMAFSPSHVAPEVLEGARAGASADLYSFASSLFTLLEGHAPFEKSDDGHPGAMLVRVLQQEPPLITRTDVPPGLVALISRTLAKSPQDRPRDVAAFLDEFELAIGSDRTSDDHRSDLKRSSEEGGSSEQSEQLERQDDESVDALIGDETVLRSSLGRPNQVPPEVPTQGVPQDARESVGDVVAVATASQGQDQTVLRSNRSGGTVETAAPRPTASRSVDKPLEARPKRRAVKWSAGVATCILVIGIATVTVLMFSQRSGYFIAPYPNQDGVIAVWKGHPGSLLWIHPTVASKKYIVKDNPFVRFVSHKSYPSLHDAQAVVRSWALRYEALVLAAEGARRKAAADAANRTTVTATFPAVTALDDANTAYWSMWGCPPTGPKPGTNTSVANSGCTNVGPNLQSTLTNSVIPDTTKAQQIVAGINSTEPEVQDYLTKFGACIESTLAMEHALLVSLVPAKDAGLSAAESDSSTKCGTFVDSAGTIRASNWGDPLAAAFPHSGVNFPGFVGTTWG